MAEGSLPLWVFSSDRSFFYNRVSSVDTCTLTLFFHDCKTRFVRDVGGGTCARAMFGLPHTMVTWHPTADVPRTLFTSKSPAIRACLHRRHKRFEQPARESQINYDPWVTIGERMLSSTVLRPDKDRFDSHGISFKTLELSSQLTFSGTDCSSMSRECFWIVDLQNHVLDWTLPCGNASQQHSSVIVAVTGCLNVKTMTGDNHIFTRS